MVRNVLVIMVILVCTTSVVSYGVYNLKDNNKLGGISCSCVCNGCRLNVFFGKITLEKIIS